MAQFMPHIAFHDIASDRDAALRFRNMQARSGSASNVPATNDGCREIHDFGIIKERMDATQSKAGRSTPALRSLAGHLVGTCV
jgi:hypothetical protein